MSTKLTYTGAEVQELLDKIEKGDFDNAKTLEGHPASYFAIASEVTSLAESFATEQGRINTLYSYFNNGSANDALRLGGQLPSYYATATQYEILQRTLSDFKSLFDSMFEKDADGNIHAKLSLWSSGGITAGGVGSGGSGGGGISYNRLDSWADYSADKAGYVLSALLGKDLDSRVSALANAGYITQSALAPYALRSEIPSLVGYATESFVTSQGYITASALGGYAQQSWVSDNYLSKTGGVVSGSLDINTPEDPTMRYFRMWYYGAGRKNRGMLRVNENNFELSYYCPTDYVNFKLTVGRDGFKYNTKDILHSGNYSDYALPKTGGTVNGQVIIKANTNGADSISSALDAIVFATKYDRIYAIGTYYPGISFNHLLSLSGGGYEESPQAWIGTRLCSTKGSELASLVFATKEDTGNTSRPIERMAIMPNGNILIGSTEDSGEKLQVNGSITANSFIGNLTGNADSATLLGYRAVNTPNFDSLNYGSNGLYYFDGDYNNGVGLPPYDSWNYSVLNMGMTSGRRQQIAIPYDVARMFVRTNTDDIWSAWREVAFLDTNSLWPAAKCLTVYGSITASSFIGNLTGNADSATKLATPRTIWGQSFDGTQDVTGALTAPAITTNSLTIGGATITYDSANEALCINGNMYALGGITAGGAGISTYSSLEARVARLEQQLNIS